MTKVKPKVGEPKNAFISRCTKGGASSAECNVFWKEAKLSVEETFELDAEILAVGKWNGVDITAEHMEQAVNNFRSLSMIDVPLKMGHNKEQKMTDGEPALGWVSDVWIKSGKVMARFIDMPKIVYDAIKAKRYKNVSIEGLFDVEHKGEKYGFVLTAVALLGVDMPAVNTLSDLQTYLIADNDLQFSSLVNFTAIGSDLNKQTKGESTMTPEEEAALRKRASDAEAKNITLTADNTVLKTAKEKAEEDKLISEKTALFTAQKVDLTAQGEKLVKEGKATPAQRDSVLKDLTEEGVESAKIVFNTLALSKGKEGMNENEQGQEESDDKKNEGLTPDVILNNKALAFSAKHDCDYMKAVDVIMIEDPKLAREYADMTGT